MSSPTAKLKVLSESMDADDITEIRALITAGADVNVRNKYDVTPLFTASCYGHIEIVKLLLANKANVNFALTDGRTSLFVASQTGHKRIVELLKQHGAKN